MPSRELVILSASLQPWFLQFSEGGIIAHLICLLTKRVGKALTVIRVVKNTLDFSRSSSTSNLIPPWCKVFAQNFPRKKDRARLGPQTSRLLCGLARARAVKTGDVFLQSFKAKRVN